ncbi:site-2 protease family protein [Halobacillus rhizosphaerae]|uniref:site-2 protease family protein n=1 Tax=Halobacillus rhizosphaerae TaxID=3064889 RepID=UPI00398B443E
MISLITLIFIAAPVSLLIHELGHVTVALFLGAENSLISLGSGQEILKGRIGKLDFRIHLFLFHGAYSLNENKQSFTNSQQALISMGGPVMNVCLSAALYFTGISQLSVLLHWLFLFNLYLAVVNLVPISIKGRKSDGYRIVKCFIKPK